MSSKKVQKVQKKEIAKKTRGRPKKVHTSEELAAMKKPKLTLAEKQAIKLKAQRAKDAEKKARGETEPKNKARFYCTNKELQAEMIKWRDSSKIVEERIISEELGKMFLAICNKILNHSNFRNYTQDVRQEMKSHALLMLVKYSHNCDAYQRDARQTFNYITTVVMNACKQILIKYYKRLNTQRELERQYIDLMAQQGIRVNSEYLQNFEDRRIVNGD